MKQEFFSPSHFFVATLARSSRGGGEEKETKQTLCFSLSFSLILLSRSMSSFLKKLTARNSSVRLSAFEKDG